MKKKYVQIIIIAIAFGASGLVLYNGFFKNDNNEALKTTSLDSAMPSASGTPGAPGLSKGSNQPIAVQVGSVDVNNLLPYGTNLDYSILDKNNLQPVGLTQIKLDFNRDVGIPESNLITPTVSGQ